MQGSAPKRQGKWAVKAFTTILTAPVAASQVVEPLGKIASYDVDTVIGFKAQSLS